MATQVSRAQACGLYPSVDLGRADRRMTQKFLDRAQVGATLQQVGCERVAEGVRGDRGLGGVMARPPSQAAPAVRGGEPPARLGEEQGRVLVGPGERVAAAL